MNGLFTRDVTNYKWLMMYYIACGFAEKWFADISKPSIYYLDMFSCIVEGSEISFGQSAHCFLNKVETKEFTIRRILNMSDFIAGKGGLSDTTEVLNSAKYLLFPVTPSTTKDFTKEMRNTKF